MRQLSAKLLPLRQANADDQQALGLADLHRVIREPSPIVCLLQRLLVRPVNGQYMVVAGHRRLRAAQAAGLTQVPVEIRNIDEPTARALQIVENLHREDVTPLEEARAFDRLRGEDRTIEDVAALVALSGGCFAPQEPDHGVGQVVVDHLAAEVLVVRREIEVSVPARNLAARHWPGALTLVLPLLRPELVPEAVTGGRDTLGLRIPDHPVPRALARELGPIAADYAMDPEITGDPIIDLRAGNPENWAHFLNNHLPIVFRVCSGLGVDPADTLLVQINPISEVGVPKSAQEIAAELNSKLAAIPGARVGIWGGNSLNLSTWRSGLRVALLGNDYDEIYAAAKLYAAAIEERIPDLTRPRIDFNPTQPQLSIKIDRRIEPRGRRRDTARQLPTWPHAAPH